MREPTERGEPVRSCIGCRSKRPQSALIRITRGPGGIEIGGPSSGRGAWLCRDGATQHVAPRCLDDAVAKRAFARAWRSQVDSDDITNIKMQSGRQVQ